MNPRYQTILPTSVPDADPPVSVRLALDQVGPLAHGVRDARMTEIMA